MGGYLLGEFCSQRLGLKLGHIGSCENSLDPPNFVVPFTIMVAESSR